MATRTEFLQNLGSPTYNFDELAKQYDLRIGISRASFEDMLTQFNITRLPDYEGATLPLFGHIIFSRPSLNIYGSNLAELQNNPMTAGYARDPYGSRLLNLLGDRSIYMYLPILTTRAITYQVGDSSIKTVNKAETYYGNVIKYGHYSGDDTMSGTMSIDFINDRYQSVLKLTYLWMMYIYLITRYDALKPLEKYENDGILDYCGSIYFLVTDMTMSRLVYWEKLTGVFPRNVPISIMSYNNAPILEDKFSIDFEYALRSPPNDPDVLYDLNELTGSMTHVNSSSYYNMDEYTALMRYPTLDNKNGHLAIGDVWARGPFINAVRSQYGIEYFLHWHGPGDSKYSN